MRRPLSYQAYQAEQCDAKAAASGMSVAAAWANPMTPAQLAVMRAPSSSLPASKAAKKKVDGGNQHGGVESGRAGGQPGR